MGWQNEKDFYTVIQKIIDYLPVVCFELPLIIIIFFYPLQGHTFNFTVFCTLWTVVFNFFKESTLSFYYSQTSCSPKSRQGTFYPRRKCLRSHLCAPSIHGAVVYKLGRELRKSLSSCQKRHLCGSHSQMFRLRDGKHS